MTKVLILDQSKSVRNILRERLEYEGFSAEAVENEAAASALCERIPFDVILSDTECKVPDAGIPFIALSAERRSTRRSRPCATERRISSQNPST